MQHLLRKAVWDDDGVRDDLRACVVEHLGDDDAVLVQQPYNKLHARTAGPFSGRGTRASPVLLRSRGRSRLGHRIGLLVAARGLAGC